VKKLERRDTGKKLERQVIDKSKEDEELLLF